MNPNCKKPRYGQLNNVDRLSNLPDFIIYCILSFLDSRQRYRTSILSKRWARLSVTTPFLEFHYYCKAKNLNPRYWPSKEASARLLDYIDTRLQRYVKEKLRVTTLRLIFPNCNAVFGCNVEEFELSRKFEELSCKVDEWILIAVRNQVARLDLDGPINYQLPEILLSAKSLRGFVARNVKIPYFNKAISIAPLQALALFECVVQERMLNHIISSCVLLKYLSVNNCSGLKTIVIPGCSRLKGLKLIESLLEYGTIMLGTSNLTCFKYSDSRFYDHWPILSSKPSLLRNLRVLDIVRPGITDENLGKRLPEFASLEILRLSHCNALKTFKISSIQLKKIYLIDCSSLLDVTIDAQSLTKFKFKGILESNLVIAISSQPSCDISVDITPDSLDTVGFFKLKKLMTGLGSCNILKIALNDDADPSTCDAIKFNEEELGDNNLGPPRDIRKLKLTLRDWELLRSTVSAFLNGLFWTCHPDFISFRVHLNDPNLTIQLFKSELEDMAKCLRHPLKRVEVQGVVNCSNLLKSNKVYVQLRLHWCE